MQQSLDTLPKSDTDYCYLDTLSPLKCRAGFGAVGRNGSLGFEGRKVQIHGLPLHRSLSAHAPSKIVFGLDEKYEAFRATAAFNDEVSTDGGLSARFHVFVDDLLASTAEITPLQPAEVWADLRGAKSLCLVTEANRKRWAHTVWVEPRLELRRNISAEFPFHDCLNRVSVQCPPKIESTRRCIVTMASAGFEQHLADLLGSLKANGECDDVPICVFVVGNAPEIDRIVSHLNCIPIHCQAVGPVNATLKSAMYSLSHLVPADEFLCLDSDMLVLQSVRPLLDAVTACCNRAILVARESNGPRYADLQDALCRVYHSDPNNFCGKYGIEKDLLRYPLVVNDGMLAGSRQAFINLARCIRGFHRITEWVDEHPELGYRNQFVLNLALAKLNCGVEASGDFNVQANYQRIDFTRIGQSLSAAWSQGAARIVHFCGHSRNMYPEFRGVYGECILSRPTSGSAGISQSTN